MIFKSIYYNCLPIDTMAHQSTPAYQEANAPTGKPRTHQSASNALAYFAATANPESPYISPYAERTNKEPHLQSARSSQPQSAVSAIVHTAANSNLRETSLEKELIQPVSTSTCSSSPDSSIYSSTSGKMSSTSKISAVSTMKTFMPIDFVSSHLAACFYFMLYRLFFRLAPSTFPLHPSFYEYLASQLMIYLLNFTH